VSKAFLFDLHGGGACLCPECDHVMLVTYVGFTPFSKGLFSTTINNVMPSKCNYCGTEWSFLPTSLKGDYAMEKLVKIEQEEGLSRG